MIEFPSVRRTAVRAAHGIPASRRIRERMRAARERHHAHDNISGYLRHAEVAALGHKVEGMPLVVLERFVVDTAGDDRLGVGAARVSAFDAVIAGSAVALPAGVALLAGRPAAPP